MTKNSRMDKIDNKYKFHLDKSKKCAIKNTKINKDAINKCSIDNHIDKKNITNNVLILMKDGGIDLDMFAIKIRDYDDTNENRNMMKNFWIEVERLILGIELFQQKDFIHHDIKPQNILFDEKKMRLNYIDFGLSESLNKLKTESINSENRQSHEWWSYPPEYKYANKKKYNLYHTSLELSDYENIVSTLSTIDKDSYDPDKISTHLRGFLSYVVFWKDKYVEDLKWLYTNGLDDYDLLIDKCFKTFDIYGLGFTLLLISDSGRHLIDPILFYDLRHLFYKTITPIYSDRIEINELVKEYKKLLLINDLITY